MEMKGLFTETGLPIVSSKTTLDVLCKYRGIMERMQRENASVPK